jgi:hypothetical protein
VSYLSLADRGVAAAKASNGNRSTRKAWLFASCISIALWAIIAIALIKIF